jgi:hypothetical protein
LAVERAVLTFKTRVFRSSCLEPYDGTMHFNAMTMAHTLQRPVVLMRSYNRIDSKVAGVDV